MRRVALVLMVTLFIGGGHGLVFADDTELFVTQMAPNALIILDMSGSMNWDPPGNPASPPNRRIDIARRVLFDLLDDNDDGTIDGNDYKSLNVRLGYMRFRASYSNDDGNPSTGNIRVLAPIGSSYKDIWDKVNDPTEVASAGTPLAAALSEANTYFTKIVDVDTKNDPAVTCRNRFVVLITDGSDTWACSGNGLDEEVGI